MATGTLSGGDKSRDKGRKRLRANQTEAWRYYGWPGSDGEAVGEVRYIIGWMADQMTRLDWRVLIDGSEDWSVDVGGVTIRSRSEAADVDEPDHPLTASRELLRVAVGWDDSSVRQTTTNLFVAGEMDYIAKAGSAESALTWEVVSVVRDRRDELVSNAPMVVHAIWPHPGDPEVPDAPLFGVLAILSELDWLQKQSRGQSANRLATRGIMGIADGLNFANGGEFWTEFEASLSARMKDPTDAAPLTLRGAKELIAPTASGMAGLSWVAPSLPYDDKIDEKIDKAIKRLAYGLPVPPEILLGMQAQSRATAFQVEENSYKAHIEPPADLVSEIPRRALELVLDDAYSIEVNPDATELLARHHTTQDALDAFDRRIIGPGYLRQALKIPDSAEPTADERAQMGWATEVVIGEADRDPGADAADEPITAAVTGPEDPMTEAELEVLSEQLLAVDYAARLELAGATALAVERARERVGSQSRSFEALRAQLPREVPNAAVAQTLSLQTLRETGVDIDGAIDSALKPLGEWWTERVALAYEQTQGVLGDEIEVVFPDGAAEASTETLLSLTREHVLATLEAKRATELDPDEARIVLAVAGGHTGAGPVIAAAGAPEKPLGGIAQGEAVNAALAAGGITVAGYRWMWRPGDLGGVFPPHQALHRRWSPDMEGFEGFAPGVPNKNSCRCDLLVTYRDERGRFARRPASDLLA